MAAATNCANTIGKLAFGALLISAEDNLGSFLSDDSLPTSHVFFISSGKAVDGLPVHW